jgi:hypothetical protein
MEAAAAPVPVRIDRGSTNGNSLATQGEKAQGAETERERGERESERERVFEQLELPESHRLSGATLGALAAVIGLAAIALGSWAFATSVRDGNTVEIVRPAPINGAAQAISLLSKPDTQRIPLQGSRGTVILAVSPAGRGLLVLDGLGIAPLGMTYQAWVVDPQKRPLEHESAGVFTGVETIVPLSAAVPPGWVLGVTVERTGGVDAPTQAFRLGAQRVLSDG